MRSRRPLCGGLSTSFTVPLADLAAAQNSARRSAMRRVAGLASGATISASSVSPTEGNPP